MFIDQIKSIANDEYLNKQIKKYKVNESKRNNTNKISK